MSEETEERNCEPSEVITCQRELKGRELCKRVVLTVTSHQGFFPVGWPRETPQRNPIFPSPSMIQAMFPWVIHTASSGGAFISTHFLPLGFCSVTPSL